MANGVVQPGDLASVFADWDSVTYTKSGVPHGSNRTVSVNGIFSSTAFDENGIEVYAPIFRCEKSTVSDITHGAKITVFAEDFDSTGQEFKVVGVQDNQLGTVRLQLEKV